MNAEPDGNREPEDKSLEAIPDIVLERFPEQDKPVAIEAIQTFIQVKQESFSGPIPPPAIFAQYNRVLPGSADRILRMAEKQEDHRHSLETKVIDSNIFLDRWGLISALTISVLVIMWSGVLILSGKGVEGFVLVIINLITLAGVFLVRQQQRQKEIDDNKKALAEAQKPPQLPPKNSNRKKGSRKNRR